GSASDDLYPFIYTDKNLYVSETGDNGNNGLSPGAAKRTIRSAIDASTGAPTYLIRVTGGRFGDNSLPLPNGAVLAGGYDPTFATRNTNVHVSEVDSGQFGFNLRSFGLDAKVVVDGLTFINGLRDGSSGGSIEFVGDQVVLSNSVILGNVTSSMGGAVYLGFSTSYGGRTTLTNNVIIGNRAFGGAGGGVVIYPIYTSGNDIDVAITDNFIVGNRSFNARGGGVAVQTNSFYGYNLVGLKMAGNTIMGNHARAGAGVDLNLASHSDTVDLMADNNVVATNKAYGEGGGLTVVGLGALSGQITGSTVAANAAGTGTAAGLTINSTVEVSPAFEARDLILWGNVSDDSTGEMSLSFSDVGGGAPPGSGNISADPVFRKGLRGSYYLSQNDPGQPTSAALDAGSDTAEATSNEAQTTAVDGTPDAGVVDMGAHFETAPPDSTDPLQIVRVDPASGDMSGTDWVAVRGTGFDPGARVNFGTPEAVHTIYVSSGMILAQPPPRAAITVGVTVTNPDLTSVTKANGFRYLDNMPPVWQTTVGAQSAESPLDCIRSVIVDWNEADDLMTPPVRYEVHRLLCDPSPGAPQPCVNYLDFIPNATTRIATTSMLSFIDTTVTQSGQTDPQYMYLVRAIDSHTPVNRELNLAKRHAIASRNVSDTTPPAAVGDTLLMPGGGLLDWGFSRGAVAYRVYRQTDPSVYANPAALSPLITLTTANNDLDMDGVVDSRHTDAGIPVPGQIYFYKVTALDPCNVETKDELLP
ncbi:MAG TPA: IPT/TIG domain-containing protein, partial [Candidatus Polarisedimenticolia bacterium]|nr:IPT/TIG domain-containing protein [Candidatus Polarisedimenticolia bacterium]